MMTSLRTRLLIAVGVLAIAAVAGVAIALRQQTRTEFLRFENRERLTASARHDAQTRALASMLDGQCCDAAIMRDAATRAGLDRDQLLLIVQPDGGALVSAVGPPLDAGTLPELSTRYADNGGTLVLDAAQRMDAVDGDARHAGRVGQIRLKFAIPGTPLRLADARAARLYIVSLPNDARERSVATFLGALDRRLLLITGMVALFALLATWTIARGITRPLQELQAATHALAQGDLTRRITIAPKSSREVAELSGAFNQMAGALERQAMLRQDLVRDVAHELRTPLTAVHCRIDAVVDGLSPDPDAALRNLLEDVRHLEHLVDDLQDIALAEAGELRLTIEAIVAIDVVRSALRTAALDTDPRLRIDIEPTLRVRGDAVRVRQVLLNLLTNAGRYTPADGVITVRAHQRDVAVGAAAEAAIEVHNSGSQLTEDQQARVFDRFYRTDPSRVRTTTSGRGGSGLGLAIVKHLVEAQGGRVWVASDATGVTFGFTLPLQERQPVA